MIKDSQTTDNKNKPPKTQHEIIATIFHILCKIYRNLILNCDDDRYNNEETYHDIVQLYDFIGMDYDEAEDYTDALCCYNEAIELFNRFLDEDTYFGLKRDIIGDIANHYALQGEFAKAADILNAAIQEANESNKDELHSIAELYSRLGNIHIETGHYSDALSDYMKALNLRKQVFDSDDINMFGIYSNLATAYDNLGDKKAAVNFFSRALETLNKNPGEQQDKKIDIFYNIANLYDSLYKYNEAKECYEKSLDYCLKYHPYDKMMIGKIKRGITSVLHSLGNNTDALSMALEILRCEEKYLKKDSTHFADTYRLLGIIHGEMGEYEKSIEYLEKNLQICDKLSLQNHQTVNTYINLAFDYSELRKFETAIDYCLKAATLSEKNHHPQHPELASIYANIGSVFCDKKDYNQALWYLNKALLIQENTSSPNAFDLGVSYCTMGEIYQGLSNQHIALEYYNKSLISFSLCLPENDDRIQEVNQNIQQLLAPESQDK